MYLMFQRVVLVFLLASLTAAIGHNAGGQSLSKGTARFTQEDTDVVVTYDLLGEEGEEYTVDLLLSMSGGDAYDYEPEAVSGDVGEEVRPGTGKQIRWDVHEDFPEGLQHPNARFKVVIEEQGGLGWLYYVGGAVVAGGGGAATAILTGIIGGGDEDMIPPLDPNPPE